MYVVSLDPIFHNTIYVPTDCYFKTGSRFIKLSDSPARFNKYLILKTNFKLN